ncbi:hypothetical protein P879_00452 [Paragonimus westermani]|uniref:ceramide glucosyltransferase n=1 Tax=Paragonimus westermani TaxID=34504 RepID=A0A8T0E0W2_9TREM|nr:hypothetical protein P879_00452 [Paragonimus westermani]
MFEASLIYPLIYFSLATVVLWIYIHQLCFFLLAIYTARRYMHRIPDKLPKCPGVSIIKPLMGCDACLRENLLSHFTLEYPKFELLFCVQDENDPAVDLVNSLRGEYPLVESHIFIGGQPGIVNPMVDNMAPAYSAAKYDLVWISTSRIFVSTEIMLDLVAKSLDSDVALVHQSPFFSDQPGFLNAMEKVCFGCSISRNQIALNQLGVVCFVGMSYIVKKVMLDEIGGLAFYGKYLAEDFFIANKLHSKGYRLVLSDFPAIQNVSDTNIYAYINRMVRWLRLRLRMLPVVAGLLEPLSEAVTLGIVFACSINYLFGVPVVYLLLGHFTIWITLDYILLRSIQNKKLPFSIMTFLLAWICRELLVYLVFVKALCRPATITWGRYSYHVRLGGLTTRLPTLTKLRSTSQTFPLQSEMTNFNIHCPNVVTTTSLVNGRLSKDGTNLP